MKISQEKTADTEHRSGREEHSREGSGLTATAQFKDNRPQAEAHSDLQARIAESPFTKAAAQFKAIARPETRNTPIQRKITIGGRTWGAGDEIEFCKAYSDHAQMVKDIRADIGNAPLTLASILEDEREIIVKQEGSGYIANLGAKAVEGGRSREVGGEPVVVSRPAEGFEDIKISGLLSCLGIYVVLMDKKVPSALKVSAVHFVTPDLVNSETKNLYGKGAKLLYDLVGMANGDGILTAAIVYTDGEDPESAENAANLAEFCLKQFGVKMITKIGNKGEVTLRFQSNGDTPFV